MLISLKNIFLEYSDKVIFDNIDFNVDERDKIGLIGINGAGKSTLLKMLYNFKDIDPKHVMIKKNLTVGFLEQDTYNFQTENILEYVCDQEVKHFDEDLTYKAKSILNKLGISDLNLELSKLSGGQKKRVALGKVLLKKVDLLILDEPTNHLDGQMIKWLENYLKNLKCAIVMITHDRYFLERITNNIIELENGKIYSYVGNFSKYLLEKEARLGRDEKSHEKQLTLLRREKKWIERGARARSTKSRERSERYYKLEEDVKRDQKENLEIDSLSTRIGKKIIELNNVTIGYENKVLIEDFTYVLERKDKIGIVGENGSGKSTLLNVLTEKLQPLKGTIELGETLNIGYFNQNNIDLDPNLKVMEYIKDIAEFIETKDGLISAGKMLEKFLFTSKKQYLQIGKLSGGEKRRLYLLGILMKAPNLLILDEPTNDLDIVTLGVLEDYLLSFPGVLIIVSHDRYFMDKIIDTLWILEDKQIRYSKDTYSQYLDEDENNGNKDNLTKSKSQDKSLPSDLKVSPKDQLPKKLKFTFQEKKEFETIDSEIEILESEISLLNEKINKAADDYGLLLELSKTLEEKTAVLEEKNERWFYLHNLNEEILNQGKK